MEQKLLRLVPADVDLAQPVTDFYVRNREFLQSFEPPREDDFFTVSHQQNLLQQEMEARKAKTGYRFYLQDPRYPQMILGTIGLNQVIWGGFRSAFLGYKMDRQFLNQGYMTTAVGMLVDFAFQELALHRIEANVMPRNKASLRVLEKNEFVMEGISPYYLNINGVWEDHVHMVKLNFALHSNS